MTSNAHRSPGLPAGVFVRATAHPDFVPTSQQQVVVDHDRGRLRVLAGPGTGKTATLVHAVASRIQRGIDPAQMLVLSYSRRAATDLTNRLYPILTVPIGEPLVRTIHGFCYALVRQEDMRAGRGQPRLTACGESGQIVADLLAGHLAAGGGPWPEYLHPALPSRTFAERVRNAILRCAERGIGPDRLAELAAAHRRGPWRALAATMQDYQQVMDLRTASTGGGLAYDQAELTLAALSLLRDPQVFQRVRTRIRRIFVDEYQDVDPAQAALIDQLAFGADELVVFGDPDQSVYAFRGSNPRQLAQLADAQTLLLTDNLRSAPQVVHAINTIARKLPGENAHRGIHAAGLGPGRAVVQLAPSSARQAALIADVLRRAHTADRLPWSELAVITGSPRSLLPSLRRAFLRAGIPLAERAGLEITEVPLARAILAALAYPGAGLTEVAAETLLTSEVGGLSSLALQRLRLALPTGAGQLVELLAGSCPLPGGLPAATARAVGRCQHLLERASELAAVPADSALWQLWSELALADGLAERSRSGGPDGRRADAALDAILALSDLAADLVTANPGSTADALLAAVDQATGDRRGYARADAVMVLSAHAAKGLEWELVVVAGVQEGHWPSTPPADGLLHTEQLLDAHADLVSAPGCSPAHIADQRRLFYVACSRARSQLVITAVDGGEDLAASRFVTELIAELPSVQPADQTNRSLDDLVAQLRGALVDADTDAADTAAATVQLARLARARVRGAAPEQWYGIRELSSTAAPMGDGPVTISPSAVEAVTNCPLRGALRRQLPAAAPSEAQFLGQVLHAAADALARGTDPAQVQAQVDQSVQMGHEPPWQRARQQRLLAHMIDQVRQRSAAAAAAGRELIGTEVKVSADLPAGPNGGPPVRIRGRIDRLERGADGGGIVTDLKTGQTVPPVAQAQANPQLAVYQYVIARGAVAGIDQPGGGELWLVRGTATRGQDPLNAEQLADTEAMIYSAARALASAEVLAVENDQCARCEVRTCCPLQPEGQQVCP